MTPKEKAKEIALDIYIRYGSGTGVLFGIPSNLKDAVEVIIKLVVEYTNKDKDIALKEQEKEIIETINIRCHKLGKPDLFGENKIIEVDNMYWKELAEIFEKDIKSTHNKTLYALRGEGIEWVIK